MTQNVLFAMVGGFGIFTGGDEGMHVFACGVGF